MGITVSVFYIFHTHFQHQEVMMAGRFRHFTLQKPLLLMHIDILRQKKCIHITHITIIWMSVHLLIVRTGLKTRLSVIKWAGNTPGIHRFSPWPAVWIKDKVLYSLYTKKAKKATPIKWISVHPDRQEKLHPLHQKEEENLLEAQEPQQHLCTRDDRRDHFHQERKLYWSLSLD